MARGFLSGAIWGTVLSVGGLGAVSVLTPGPEDVVQPRTEPVVAESDNAVDTSAPEAAATEPPATSDTTAATGPETDTEPMADAAPEAQPEPSPDPQPQPAPESTETDATALEAETAPDTDKAEASTPEQEPAVPSRRPSDEAAVTVTAESPDLASPDPSQDATPADTAAAPMPAPDTGDDIAALDAPDAPNAPAARVAPGGDASPDAAPAPTLQTPESETGLNVSTEPAQPPAPSVPEGDSPLVPDPETRAEPDPTPEPDDTASPETGSTDADGADQSDRPQVRRLVPDAAEEQPWTDDTTAALQRPTIGRPAGSIIDRNAANGSRLPSIGTAAQEEDTAPQAAPSADSSLPPLERYAADVQIDPALPKMSIVMIDDGTGPLGPDTLDSFPFPVTFALDPGHPDAAARMQGYRALGYEVAVLVDLPDAAQPADVEQILAGATAAVPESVALIEAPGGPLQGGRDVTEQATRFAADSGHGLVFVPNGLNTAQAIARRENVPAVSILRDFDGEGQDARTKRRFLDGAAFRARQDGSVVMLGRLTPDTLSALLLWSLQDRASSVAMVPVSTILRESSD